MIRDPWERRQRRKRLVAALAVGVVISALVALGLIYLGQTHLGS